MSKRNFILLLIVLVIIVLAVLAYMFFSGTKGGMIPDEGGTNFFAKFNPFGKNNNQNDGTNDDEEVSTDTTPETTTEELKLRKISTMPVAGYGIFVKERFKEVKANSELQENNEFQTQEISLKKATPPVTEFVPAVRYVARATGNIYQTFVDKLEERRFSSTLVPQVYEAFFGNKAESVVMRYLKSDGRTIQTFLGTLPKEVLGGDTSDTNELKGSFLPENITNLSLSPDLFNIFYLLEIGESVVGTTSNASGEKKNQIFNSHFTEWLSDWTSQKIITLTTKPAYGVPGHVYFLDPVKKSFSRILGDIKGLTTMTSPSGKFILVGNDNLSLSIYTLSSKSTYSIPIRTLPEKCAWASNESSIYCLVPTSTPGSGYPDVWYRGEVSFSDQIWKFDIITGTTELIMDPFTENFGEIDGIKPALSKDEKYLFFVDKQDSFLWVLTLN